MTSSRQLRQRLFWALPIVGLWLTMTGLLLHRELAASRPLAPSGLGAEPTADTWFGVYLAGGRRVGYLHYRQTPEQREGEAGGTLEIDARVLLELMGKSTELEISGSIWRASAVAKATFAFQLATGGYELAVDGHVEKGTLEAQLHSMGEAIPLRLPLDDSFLLADGLGSALRLPLLEVGEEQRLASFDLLTLRAGRSRVRCVARATLALGGEPIATRLLVVESGGISSRAWIDEEGQVVRAETPLGLVLEKTSPEEALDPIVPGATGGFLELTAVHPSGVRPFRGARSMRVRLTGGPTEQLPTDDVQTWIDGGSVVVVAPAEPALKEASNSRVAAKYLGSDPLIQTDHPRIQTQAAAIVGQEADPWQKALRIYRWVFENVEKEAVPSVPSALAVLEERRGDCNEHTVLFAALARAAGLPTRLAVGLVWSEDLDGLYYHAWPEVYLGRWVWMDPTLGQPLADATHLKLLEGGVESWPRLAAYLGQLHVEVLEVR